MLTLSHVAGKAVSCPLCRHELVRFDAAATPLVDADQYAAYDPSVHDQSFNIDSVNGARINPTTGEPELHVTWGPTWVAGGDFGGGPQTGAGVGGDQQTFDEAFTGQMRRQQAAKLAAERAATRRGKRKWVGGKKKRKGTRAPGGKRHKKDQDSGAAGGAADSDAASTGALAVARRKRNGGSSSDGEIGIATSSQDVWVGALAR